MVSCGIKSFFFFFAMFILNGIKILHSKCLPQPPSEKQEIKHSYNMSLEVNGPVLLL